MMMPMKKTENVYEGTHFALVSGAEIETCDIVQIWPRQLYENKAGYAVFLCEVKNKKETESNGN